MDGAKQRGGGQFRCRSLAPCSTPLPAEANELKYALRKIAYVETALPCVDGSFGALLRGAPSSGLTMSAEAFPLRDSVFRRLFAAQVIALAGTGLSTVALALLAYELAGGNAGTVLGTALALKMIAYVAIAPLAGALARRFPRRGLLVSLDLARALLIACMPFVNQVWQIYALIVALNACSAGFTPAYQATVADVLPDDARYTRALSLSRLAYDLENLLSPMLAAAALVFLSYNALFVTNALTFLGSSLLILSVNLPSVSEHAADRTAGVTFGIRAYLSTPRLRGLLALCLAVACAGALVLVNTVVYVRDQMGGSESETALAYAAFGAGSMVAALALPRFLDRWSDRPFMLSGGLLLSLALAAGLFGLGWWPLLLIWAALGVGSSLIQTPSGRLLKRSAREADRPALFAAHFSLSHGCWLLGYLLAGWLGRALDSEALFLVLAVLCVASTLAARRLWPAQDPLELEHTHEALEHDHLHVHDAHHQHQHEGWEGPEPHHHTHRHESLRHKHAYTVDLHHSGWPAA